MNPPTRMENRDLGLFPVVMSKDWCSCFEKAEKCRHQLLPFKPVVGMHYHPVQGESYIHICATCRETVVLVGEWIK